MVYVAIVFLYILFGGVTQFMMGYVTPVVQMRASTRVDLATFLIWPYYFPSISGTFGAVIRTGLTK